MKYINFYNFRSKPDQLYNYNLRDNIPDIAWELCYYDSNGHKEKYKKYEHLWKLNAEYAYRYASNVLHERWPPGEKIILTNSKVAGCYAKTILKDRWIEAEPIIASNAEASYYYAMHVFDGKRFEIGEPAIIKDPYSAMMYATDIIKGRWPEAEESIAKVDWILHHYNSVLTKNWNQKIFLQFILENSDKFVD